jgi:hypothetical protein
VSSSHGLKKPLLFQVNASPGAKLMLIVTVSPLATVTGLLSGSPLAVQVLPVTAEFKSMTAFAVIGFARTSEAQTTATPASIASASFRKSMN